MTSKTELMLMFQYDGQPAIKLDECLDHLGYSKVEANRYAGLNRLPIPTFRLRDSQKSPRMVHVKDLAAHIDNQHALAKLDWERMNT